MSEEVVAGSMQTTRQRIVEAALDLFGARGVDGVSLDDIAAVVGVRKQTLLYWFASKDELVVGVLATAAEQLSLVIDAAVRAAPNEPLGRIDAVVCAVFRPAVRRPALLGLVREISRLPTAQADEVASRIRPLIDRATSYMAAEMAAGRLEPATRRSRRRSPTPRSPASPPSPRRCGQSAGNPPAPACAPSATSRSPRLPPAPPHLWADLHTVSGRIALPADEIPQTARGTNPAQTVVGAQRRAVSVWCCGGGGSGDRGRGRRGGR
ncbi:MAG: TetR/AcrR family transcriptional regulator [Ilumatobacteraceae bacterium]